MLNTLLVPLLFSMLGGMYVYFSRPDQRPRTLLILTLFQLVGAYGYTSERSGPLFALLLLHASVVFFLLLNHLQTPALAPERQRSR